MLSINKREITPPFTSLRSFSSPSPTSTSLPLSHKLKASTRSEDNTSDELQTTGLSEAKFSKARELRGSHTSGSNSSYQSFTLPKANTSTRSQNTRPSRTTPLVHPFVEALNLLDRARTGGRGLSSTSGSTEAVATSLIGDHTLPSTVDRRLSSTGTSAEAVAAASTGNLVVYPPATSTDAIGDLLTPDLASYRPRGLRVRGRDLSSGQSSRNQDKSTTQSSRLSSARSTQSSDSKPLSLEESLDEIAELLNSDLPTTQRSRRNVQPAQSSRRSSARSAHRPDSKDYSLEEDLADIAKLVNAPRETLTRPKVSSSTKLTSSSLNISSSTKPTLPTALKALSSTTLTSPVALKVSSSTEPTSPAALKVSSSTEPTSPAALKVSSALSPTSPAALNLSSSTGLTSTPVTASHNKNQADPSRAPVHLIKRKPVGSGSSKKHTSSEENPADIAERVIIPKETLPSTKVFSTPEQDRVDIAKRVIVPKETLPSTKVFSTPEQDRVDITERVIIPKETLPSTKVFSTPEQDRAYVDKCLSIPKQTLSRKAVGSGSKKRTSSEKEPTHIAERVNILEETLPARKNFIPEEDRSYIAEFLNVPKETLPSPKVWDTPEEERAYVAERLNILNQTLPPPQPSSSRKLTPRPVIAYRSQHHSSRILKDTLPVTKVNTLSGDSTSRPSVGPYSEDNSSRTLRPTSSSPKVALSGGLTSRPTTGPHSEYNTSPTPKPLVIRKRLNSGSKGSSYRFLGRHHSLEDTPRIARSASFGTARELRSSALTTYRERTSSLPKPSIPPRAASLGRIQEGEVPRAVISRSVSISSAEQLRDLLSASRPPLYLDLPRRRNVDIIFPPSVLGGPPATISHRRPSGSKALSAALPPPPPTATPLIYRSASGALRDHLGPKQPVFVPARIDRRRNATASSAMATRGSSSNPFDNPPDHWQGVCPVRVESAMTQPGPVPATPPAPARAPPPPPAVAAAAPAASAAAVAAATAAAANAAAPGPAAPAPAAPRRRGVFRRVGRALRRLVGGGRKE